MTASGHRITVWIRANSVLYAGAPSGRVWPVRGRFLTRAISAGDVATHLIDEVIADVKAKARG